MVFDNPYRHYRFNTGVYETKEDNNQKIGSLIGNSANSINGYHPTLGMSLYNFEPFKSLQPKDYDLLNISSSEDRPYFFGLGLSSKFNCNHGFQHN